MYAPAPTTRAARNKKRGQQKSYIGSAILLLFTGSCPCFAHVRAPHAITRGNTTAVAPVCQASTTTVCRVLRWHQKHLLLEYLRPRSAWDGDANTLHKNSGTGSVLDHLVAVGFLRHGVVGALVPVSRWHRCIEWRRRMCGCARQYVPTTTLIRAAIITITEE